MEISFVGTALQEWGSLDGTILSLGVLPAPIFSANRDPICSAGREAVDNASGC